MLYQHSTAMRPAGVSSRHHHHHHHHHRHHQHRCHQHRCHQHDQYHYCYQHCYYFTSLQISASVGVWFCGTQWLFKIGQEALQTPRESCLLLVTRNLRPPSLALKFRVLGTFIPHGPAGRQRQHESRGTTPAMHRRKLPS